MVCLPEPNSRILLDLFRQVFEGLVDVELVECREALQHLEVELVAPVPALYGARRERQRRMRDHPLRIEEGDLAEAVALRARAHRVVEREQARLEFLQRIRADRAGELGAEQMLLVGVHFQRDGAAVGEAQRGFERFGEALLHVGAHFQTVDHDVDRMLVVLLQLGQRVHFVDLRDLFIGGAAARTHAKADKALRLHFLEQFDVFALAVRHHRRQDHQLGVFRQRERGVDHLRDALRLQRNFVVRAIGRADPREQQTQVVVNLGDGADRGARIVRRGLLFDRNGRRQTFDQVDVRLFHQLQELPGVRGEAFDVAPLPFRVERVKGKRRFARARQAGNHDELVTRQVETDVLQVVGTGPTDTDLFHALIHDLAIDWRKEEEAKPATITTFQDRCYDYLTAPEQARGEL